jgi:hypothetical protein
MIINSVAISPPLTPANRNRIKKVDETRMNTPYSQTYKYTQHTYPEKHAYTNPRPSHTLRTNYHSQFPPRTPLTNKPVCTHEHYPLPAKAPTLIFFPHTHTPMHVSLSRAQRTPSSLSLTLGSKMGPDEKQARAA